MEGEPWTAVEAGVRRGDDGLLTVSLFAEDLDECALGHDASTSQVLFTVPAEPGEYPLRFDLSDLAGSRVVNFSPSGGENILATEGVIVVDDVSETEVTIGVLAMTDASEINGRFTATICP